MVETASRQRTLRLGLNKRAPTQVCALAAPVRARGAVAPAKSRSTLFASQPKYMSRCPEWLKVVKNKTTFEKHLVLDIIHKGELCDIWAATTKETSEKVIIKSYRREKLLGKPSLQRKVKLEWQVHCMLDHSHVVQPYMALEDRARVGLYMEYAGHQDVYKYLDANSRVCMTDTEAKELMFDILSALDYMHGKGIIHRDVKCDNVFRTLNGVWKLGDFGGVYWTHSAEEQPLSVEGTFSFAAPEYVRLWDEASDKEMREATSTKLDSWSAGAMAYDVLVGRPPFAPTEDIAKEDERRAILEDEVVIPESVPLTDHAYSFILQALEKNPKKRPTVRQLLHHPWFES